MNPWPCPPEPASSGCGHTPVIAPASRTTTASGTPAAPPFVHQYVPVDSVAAWGGTVVNIHHATEINPYINYPFFNLEAHEKGIKVKLYNTIREMSCPPETRPDPV